MIRKEKEKRQIVWLWQHERKCHTDTGPDPPALPPCHSCHHFATYEVVGHNCKETAVSEYMYVAVTGHTQNCAADVWQETGEAKEKVHKTQSIKEGWIIDVKSSQFNLKPKYQWEFRWSDNFNFKKLFCFCFNFIISLGSCTSGDLDYVGCAIWWHLQFVFLFTLQNMSSLLLQKTSTDF